MGNYKILSNISYEFLEELKNKYKNDLFKLIMSSSAHSNSSGASNEEVRSKMVIENGYVFDQQSRSLLTNDNSKLRTYSIFKKDVGVMELLFKTSRLSS